MSASGPSWTAEDAAADWMRRHGFQDATVMNGGVDTGVHVIASRAVATLRARSAQLRPKPAARATQTTETQQQAESIKRENAVIRHDNAMLRAQVDDLQNGYEALSELARSELGYIEEGETYYNLKRE